MKRLRLALPFVLVSFLPAPLCAQTSAVAPAAGHFPYAEKIRAVGLPNAGKINDHLYRGAQPRSAGLLELKKLGITTIVDLRAEDAAKADWEERKSESLGIRFIRIPVSGWAPPTNEQIAQFLAIFREHPDEKVFVHCHFGDDRTGVFVASYRMAFENVAPEEALKEMFYFGFNGFWHPSMASFVRNFPERLASAPVLTPFTRTNGTAASPVHLPANTPK